MKTAVILGTGQAGQAALRLLDRNNIQFLSFGDNDKSKHSGGAIPVMSVEAAIGLEPDIAVIGVMGAEREKQLIAQVNALGYAGDMVSVNQLRSIIDIRAASIRLIADEIQSVEGSIAELGVFRGDLAWQLSELFPERKIFLFDTFEGFDERDIAEEDYSKSKINDFSDTSVEYVLSRIKSRENVCICKGYFPESATGLEDETFALVSLDPDLYQPCLKGLSYFYPRLSEGGMIVIHDYNSFQYTGIKRAVDEFRITEHSIRLVPLADMHGTAVIVK